MYYSGPADKHGVGFIVNSTVTNMGCQTVSGRMITIRLKSTPFNVTIIQLYEHTLDYSDEETDEFYEQLQYVIEQVAKKDILIVQSNWNAKVGEDGTTIWNIIWSIQAVTKVDTAQSKQ